MEYSSSIYAFGVGAVTAVEVGIYGHLAEGEGSMWRGLWKVIAAHKII